MYETVHPRNRHAGTWWFCLRILLQTRAGNARSPRAAVPACRLSVNALPVQVCSVCPDAQAVSQIRTRPSFLPLILWRRTGNCDQSVWMPVSHDLRWLLQYRNGVLRSGMIKDAVSGNKARGIILVTQKPSAVMHLLVVSMPRSQN